MIGNLNNKDKFALLYLTILTLIAVAYGFSIIPSPAKEQAIANDYTRVVDLGEMQSSIDSYYQDHGILPQTLVDVTTNIYDSTSALEKTDPQTKQPYTYMVTGPYSYKLCATFVFNSSSEQADSYDTTVSDYPIFSNQFKHPAGYYCFTEKEKVNTYTPIYNNNSQIEVPQNYRNETYPSVSPTTFPTAIEEKPSAGSSL